MSETGDCPNCGGSVDATGNSTRENRPEIACDGCGWPTETVAEN